MFVTDLNYVVSMPKSLSGKDEVVFSRAWFQASSTFYFLVFHVDDCVVKDLHGDLAGALRAIREADDSVRLHSMHIVVPPYMAGSTDWKMFRIDKLWLPKGEVPGNGMEVFECEGRRILDIALHDDDPSNLVLIYEHDKSFMN